MFSTLVGSTLGGCSRRAKPVPQSRVSISGCSRYDNGLYDIVRRIFTEHRLDVRAKRVLLKPNLVEFEPGSTINTHPMLVHAAMEALFAMGAADVRIAEGPGHRRITLDLAEAAGYFSVIPQFERRFTDLNLEDVSLISLVRPFSKLNSIYLPRLVLNCDLLVSMPKMKTHHWVGATLSMKNLFGVVPGAVYGWPKNVLHWAGIHECIADLYRHLPRHFALVDGIDCMEGNGPIQGRPKHVGALVAGQDLTAVDATCCRIMGIEPARVRYLKLAAQNGQTTASNIIQIGESIPRFQTRFDLIPHLEYLHSTGEAGV